MKGFVLVALISCVFAIPAYVTPYTGRNGPSWIRKVLECPALLYGGRCREVETRTQQSLPQRMTVLEIVEEEPGRVRIIQDPHIGPYAIKVPHEFDIKPKCKSSEIYIGELDICVPAEDHVVKTKLGESGKTKRDHQKLKEDKKEPVTILEVGSYEKEKCGSDEIWVPEVATCLHKNPPPPIEPEDDDSYDDY